MITAYTLIDDTAIIYNIPNGQSDTTAPSSIGTTAHDTKAIVSPNIGAIINIIWFEWLGTIVSFVNSFTPSANGCNIPPIPTTFGPFLNCIDPSTFLSANVTNATAINTGTIIAILFIGLFLYFFSLFSPSSVCLVVSSFSSLPFSFFLEFFFFSLFT